MQEVRILKGIRHPNVLFFRGLCLQPPMIITELCDHGSVSDVIELTNRMGNPDALFSISDDKRIMYNVRCAHVPLLSCSAAKACGLRAASEMYHVPFARLAFQSYTAAATAEHLLETSAARGCN